MPAPDHALSAGDLAILRRLAERKLALAHGPVNAERRRAWLALDAGTGDRVMLLAEHGGVRDEQPPLPATALACTDPWARNLEAGLRNEIYCFEELRDDHVIEPWINLNWRVDLGHYGVESVHHFSDAETRLGAYAWDPPLRDLERDFERLRPRVFAVDRAATLAEQARLEEIFGDRLPVRIRGAFYWSLGMTMQVIFLLGLEEFMLAMCDQPAALHRLMAFLRDDHLALVGWLEREGLYTLNNENDYIGSGSMGYAAALPHGAPGGPVKTGDLWALLESQETVGVGPGQFAEFVFPYQAALAERFGRIYYGCCEPLHGRWQVIRRLPRLARVSVSPWADQEFLAAELGRNYVFSRKPNPTLVSTGIFDEAAIRADLRRTLAAARDCRLEIIMKDVHTLHNEPGRLPRWVQLAREEVARAGRG